MVVKVRVSSFNMWSSGAALTKALQIIILSSSNRNPGQRAGCKTSGLPGRRFRLLTQQLFLGPPPGPGSVRSLMESAGSKLTHEKRANKSLQLLVSAPGWLARPHSLIGHHLTFHTSPGEPHFLFHGS